MITLLIRDTSDLKLYLPAFQNLPSQKVSIFVADAAGTRLLGDHSFLPVKSTFRRLLSSLYPVLPF